MAHDPAVRYVTLKESKRLWNRLHDKWQPSCTLCVHKKFPHRVNQEPVGHSHQINWLCMFTPRQHYSILWLSTGSWSAALWKQQKTVTLCHIYLKHHGQVHTVNLYTCVCVVPFHGLYFIFSIETSPSSTDLFIPLLNSTSFSPCGTPNTLITVPWIVNNIIIHNMITRHMLIQLHPSLSIILWLHQGQSDLSVGYSNTKIMPLLP